MLAKILLYDANRKSCTCASLRVSSRDCLLALATEWGLRGNNIAIVADKMMMIDHGILGFQNSKTGLNLARHFRGEVTQPTEWAHESFSSNIREVCLHIGPYPSSNGLIAL